MAARELLFKVQQVFDARPAPGIDGLIRVADDEQVLMVSAQHLHQPVLQLVDVLKFVDHDVFQPLLPLQADGVVLLKDIERKLD